MISSLVTEMEIEAGILKANQTSQSTVVFHRAIQGFTNFEDPMTKRHIDTEEEDGKVIHIHFLNTY